MSQTRAFTDMILSWLQARLDAQQLAWVADQSQRIQQNPGPRALALAIGLAPRKIGKADLALSKEEAAQASATRTNLDTTGWTADGAARAFFVLCSYCGDDAAFAARLDAVMATAEISELMAVLRGLPLYPAPASLVPRAVEGVRSAMLPVFESVAHRNPFPAEHFSHEQWNQMVVKALFIGSTLAPIQGLDERRNAELATILVDYAHERWAAGRAVSPELWRCVGPFADEAGLAALERVMTSGTRDERRAAAAALAECPAPAARSILQRTRLSA